LVSTVTCLVMYLLGMLSILYLDGWCKTTRLGNCSEAFCHTVSEHCDVNQEIAGEALDVCELFVM
jgi:hypothetical protein